MCRAVSGCPARPSGRKAASTAPVPERCGQPKRAQAGARRASQHRSQVGCRERIAARSPPQYEKGRAPAKVAAAAARQVMPPSNRFLELLGGAEGNLLAGLDLDGLAGGRVAAHARRTLAHLQDAQAADADAGAL